MSRLVKLAASERWTHFLESTAIGLHLNLTLLFPEPLAQVQAPDACPVCGVSFPILPTSEAARILSLEHQALSVSGGVPVVISRLRDGLVMVARDCPCSLEKWSPLLEERAKIAQRLLASFQTALTESITGGQRATELSALRQMNQIVLSLFQGGSKAIEQTFDLILSALVILSEGQGSWLEYQWRGKEYLLTKGDKEAVNKFITKGLGEARTAPLESKSKNGRLGVLSPSDQEQAASILSLFAQECVIISEIAELFQLLQDQFGQVLGSIASAVLLVNKRFTILYANQAAASLLDCDALDLLGSEVSAIDAPWTPVILADARQCITRQMESLGPDDKRRWVDWQVSPMRNSEDMVGWVVLADDRTDYYNWQEAGRRAERLAITASMVGALAHELRNPLSAAKGLLQLSRRKPEKAASYNDLVLRELDRVTRLLNEFLLMGRIENNNQEVLDPAAFISELLPLLEGETVGSNVEIVREFSEVPCISFDQGQFTQILLNLVRIAVEATGTFGQVTLRLRREGEWVALDVQDQGPGISAEAQEKLFRPFFTTKERGTGLGLAVTQAIIHSHGGEIIAKNAENGGAVFSVLFPVYHEVLTSEIDVMIVSDDELLRYPVRRMLVKAGLTTISYTTPEEAFTLGSSIVPKLVLFTSLTSELQQEIQKNWPKSKVITIDRPDEASTLEDVYHICKPLDYARLVTHIKTAVEEWA